jgi:hypothetical protein
MAATDDMVGGMVPEASESYKASWAAPPQESRPPSSDIVPMTTTDSPIYHFVRVSFTPPTCLPVLVIAFLATFLLKTKPKAWQLLERLVERIEFLQIPRFLTLAFRRDEPPKLDHQPVRRQAKKEPKASAPIQERKIP